MSSIVKYLSSWSVQQIWLIFYHLRRYTTSSSNIMFATISAATVSLALLCDVNCSNPTSATARITITSAASTTFCSVPEFISRVRTMLMSTYDAP